MKTESIQAITPLFLGAIGCILGLAVILSPNTSDTKSSGFQLALAAIAGASGLARSGASESSSIQGDRIHIDSLQDKPKE